MKRKRGEPIEVISNYDIQINYYEFDIDYFTNIIKQFEERSLIIADVMGLKPFSIKIWCDRCNFDDPDNGEKINKIKEIINLCRVPVLFKFTHSKTI